MGFEYSIAVGSTVQRDEIESEMAGVLEMYSTEACSLHLSVALSFFLYLYLYLYLYLSFFVNIDKTQKNFGQNKKMEIAASST